MERWNGWGDSATSYPLRESAATWLATRTGPPNATPSVALESIRVPPARLPAQPLVSTDSATRVRHARGQSLPDWIALRYGRIDAFPDGVAFPESSAQVRTLLDFAQQCGAQIIPYGGGTSVVGGINVQPGSPPAITLDLSRLNALRDYDEVSRLATFGAGVTGPMIENALRPHGATLGHYPQSWEFSTLGGWIATRSSGQQSLGYGRIEDLFAGGVVETPRGRWPLPTFPASAAGPDLRQIVLGSEGRLGVITEAVVRVRARPEREEFRAALLPTWDAGTAALQQLVTAGLPLSMLRLSDPEETGTFFAQSLSPRARTWAQRSLRLVGLGQGRCLLLYGLTGAAGQVRRAGGEIQAVVRRAGGWILGQAIGRRWARTRFRTAYLRNALWERGWAVDTLETAVPWSGLSPLKAALLSALRCGLDSENERVHAFGHLSHVYPDGATIYVTYIFRLAPDPEQTLEWWRALKRAASETIVAHGGTISHQHGVGLDHREYLTAEKGTIGMDLLAKICRTVDPDGLMNAGKLV